MLNFQIWKRLGFRDIYPFHYSKVMDFSDLFLISSETTWFVVFIYARCEKSNIFIPFFLLFQDEKNEIISTNMWVIQVSVLLMFVVFKIYTIIMSWLVSPALLLNVDWYNYLCPGLWDLFRFLRPVLLYETWPDLWDLFWIVSPMIRSRFSLLLNTEMSVLA